MLSRHVLGTYVIFESSGIVIRLRSLVFSSIKYIPTYLEKYSVVLVSMQFLRTRHSDDIYPSSR